MKEIILNGSSGAFYVLIITIVLVIAKHLFSLLRAYLVEKRAEAAATQKESLVIAFNAALTVLDQVTATTVSRIETTKAIYLRDAVKKGEIAADELFSLSSEAYQSILEQLQPVVMEGIEGCVNDTELFIRQKIEEILPEIKAKYSGIKTSGETAKIEESESATKPENENTTTNTPDMAIEPETESVEGGIAGDAAQ
ncbi:MAG: hypothetical protein PHX08_01885 [Lachnospiraceae bacterium]|nr:hypothetical protein [Lachnospiraceae bacterium]